MENEEDVIVSVKATDLRMNDDYIFYYNNLAKLIITGVVPFVALCVFNSKVGIYNYGFCTTITTTCTEFNVQIRAGDTLVTHAMDHCFWTVLFKNFFENYFNKDKSVGL